MQVGQRVEDEQHGHGGHGQEVQEAVQDAAELLKQGAVCEHFTPRSWVSDCTGSAWSSKPCRFPLELLIGPTCDILLTGPTHDFSLITHSSTYNLPNLKVS